jgi:hypothetical protein
MALTFFRFKAHKHKIDKFILDKVIATKKVNHTSRKKKKMCGLLSR